MNGEIPNGTRAETCTAGPESLLGLLLPMLLLSLFCLITALPPALRLLLPTCPHLPVMVSGPVQSLLQVFSSYQHNTLSPAPKFLNPMGFLLPWSCLHSSATSLLSHLLCVWGRTWPLSLLVVQPGEHWVLNIIISLGFFCAPKPWLLPDAGFFVEAVLSLCSSGLEQAYFCYHCSEIAGELIYQNWLIRWWPHTYTFLCI